MDATDEVDPHSDKGRALHKLICFRQAHNTSCLIKGQKAVAQRGWPPNRLEMPQKWALKCPERRREQRERERPAREHPIKTQVCATLSAIDSDYGRPCD
mmetsp:Transcript_13185/g.35303  ORF Transcript_13185/g.35303 Transcript_13185/m.35303 type:complete len:99 (-) Transcript_13185:95-391(-)